MIDGYRLSTDKKEMDHKAIYDYISKSYWGKSITSPTLSKAIKNSICFGIFDLEDKQVAFARIVTDLATFAYIMDVYVLDEHKGKGLGKWLMKEIMTYPAMDGLRVIGLKTKDAHGLYKKFGFKQIENPEWFMEISNLDQI